jgi:hypothetical protein
LNGDPLIALNHLLLRLATREKNRPPDQRRPINLTREEFRMPLKMDPNTRAYEMLSQIAILIRVDLGARVIEVVVFNEGAELRGPIVI